MYKIKSRAEQIYIKEWELKSKPFSTVAWNNYVNSCPIEDMRGWQQELGYMCGIFGNVVEFNQKTFSYICHSDEYRRLGYEKIRSPSDLIDLLWSKVNPIVNNNLKDGKVIIKSIGKYLPTWYKDLEATVF